MPAATFARTGPRSTQPRTTAPPSQRRGPSAARTDSARTSRAPDTSPAVPPRARRCSAQQRARRAQDIRLRIMARSTKSPMSHYRDTPTSDGERSQPRDEHPLPIARMAHPRGRHLRSRAGPERRGRGRACGDGPAPLAAVAPGAARQPGWRLRYGVRGGAGWRRWCWRSIPRVARVSTPRGWRRRSARRHQRAGWRRCSPRVCGCSRSPRSRAGARPTCAGRSSGSTASPAYRGRSPCCAGSWRRTPCRGAEGPSAGGASPRAASIPRPGAGPIPPGLGIYKSSGATTLPRRGKPSRSGEPGRGGPCGAAGEWIDGRDPCREFRSRSRSLAHGAASGVRTASGAHAGRISRHRLRGSPHPRSASPGVHCRHARGARVHRDGRCRSVACAAGWQLAPGSLAAKGNSRRAVGRSGINDDRPAPERRFGTENTPIDNGFRRRGSGAGRGSGLLFGAR